MSELTMVRLMFLLPYISLGDVAAWLMLRGEKFRWTLIVLAMWVALTWPFWAVTWLICRFDGGLNENPAARYRNSDVAHRMCLPQLVADERRDHRHLHARHPLAPAKGR